MPYIGPTRARPRDAERRFAIGYSTFHSLPAALPLLILISDCIYRI